MTVKPPRQKLPPLNALRAFEAAARLGGISKAADELCVTPGAVAQHIKALEGWAGAPLFRRHARGVVLNELGHRSAADFEAAFDHLSTAVQSLRTRAAPDTIRIAALPSLAQLWLSPLMPAIRAALPEARISITALEQPPNMDREGYDLSVFLEPVHSKGGTVLALDHITPVCAPALAEGIRTQADLARCLWLRDTRWNGDWDHWLQAAGAIIDPAPETLSYSLYALAVEEACNGAGVLMGHIMLLERHLASGALVAPLGGAVATGQAIKVRRRDSDKRALSGQIVDLLARFRR